MKRFDFLVAIVSVAASAILACGMVLAGASEPLGLRILGSTATITLASVVAVACERAWERRRARAVSRVGVVLATVAAALTILLTWSPEEPPLELRNLVVSAWTLATAAAHAALLSIVPLGRAHLWAKVATYGVNLAWAATLIGVTWNESWRDEAAQRAVWCLGILLVGTTVLCQLLERMGASARARSDVSARFCPACGRAWESEVGPCAGCGAKTRVEFLS
jgi:hypothetical protein